MTGVRSEGGAPLLHDFAYYTLNQIPSGARLAASGAPVRPIAAAPSARVAPSRAVIAKRQTAMPAEWNGTVDQTVSIQAVDGLKYSLTTFDVKPGARVRGEFSNASDMMHNVVFVKPGSATRVADAALKLGLNAMRDHFVPQTDEVLHYTALLEPQKSETIYFEAPTAPGDYTFVCTFPGHALTMTGTMRVRR
jgi:azurin